MEFVADFHIHSKYSRATSRDMDIVHIAEWAKLKGITLMGTGDFTHHLWLEELKSKLESTGKGLFTHNGIHFILSAEVSSIYSKNNRTYRIHNLILAPSFKTVDAINRALGAVGNLASDGRPILGLDAAELARIVFDIDENCMLIPAHCLLPDEVIHTKSGFKKIKDVTMQDQVYTHKLNHKRVQEVLSRPYNGRIYHIRPYYFREGLSTTPEHPFYVIKTHKDCRWISAPCRPNCSQTHDCRRRYFQDYKAVWCQAKDIEKGDVLLFPRFKNNVKDKREFEVSGFLRKSDYILNNDKISPRGNKITKLKNVIKINASFCRLVGYYVSEGYTNGRDAIFFCFHENERAYIEDVKKIMRDIFGISLSKMRTTRTVKGVELIYYSKILFNLFKKLFYLDLFDKRAHAKCLPSWMLDLPLEKQAEIIKGWWRGDAGYTSSRDLMNQMKIILLRLGIIPSIRIDTRESHQMRGKHKFAGREIRANYDNYHFSNLSFFEDKFNLLQDTSFKKFKTKLKRRHGWIDDKYVYLPVRDIEIKRYKGDVYNLEVKDDNSYVSEFAIIHNCWTPWFSLFGSMSGFDKIEDCFEKSTPKIFALETGLSSDPAMNWRLSALDRFVLISNSDSHSPSKIGREANVFDCDLDYGIIRECLRAKDKKKFLYTIEFFPEEGKYHYDGHRLCKVSFSPEESKKYANRCPKCKKPLTIGVLNRVAQLADRKEGFVPEGAIPFKSLIPLDEIIADVRQVGKGSVSVEREYRQILARFGTELDILTKVPQEELQRAINPKVALGIARVRLGRVKVLPGYDGEYGKVSIFGEEERKGTDEQQLSLF